MRSIAVVEAPPTSARHVRVISTGRDTPLANRHPDGSTPGGFTSIIRLEARLFERHFPRYAVVIGMKVADIPDKFVAISGCIGSMQHSGNQSSQGHTLLNARGTSKAPDLCPSSGLLLTHLQRTSRTCPYVTSLAGQ